MLATLRQHHIDFQKDTQGWVRLRCPECRKSGDVHEDKTLCFKTVGRITGHCFRCGWKGNEKELLQVLSISVLQENDFPSFEQPKQKSYIQHVPEEATPAWQNTQARRYLQGRGLTEEEAERYAILYCKSGYLHDRIILPIFDMGKQYRSFVSRAICDRAEGPKYLYPRDAAISHLLYNLVFLYRKRQYCWLVEGVFDCFYTYPYSVGIFGKKISDAQVRLLRMSGFQEIYMILDHEARENTPEICEANMQKLSQYFITWEVRLPHSTVTEFPIDELHMFCRESRKNI